DGCWGKPPGFQLVAVSENDAATECQSRFGAVPGNEVIDGEGVGTFRRNRSKALQNRSLGVVKIRQAQHVFGRAASAPGRLPSTGWLPMTFAAPVQGSAIQPV